MADGHRFWLAKRPELYNKGIPFNPNNYIPIVIPNEFVEFLIPVGQEMAEFLDCSSGEVNTNNQEHQLQLIFIILQNIPGDNEKMWTKVIDKLYQMGRFATVFTNKESLQKVIGQACLMGQFITPAIMKWLDGWLHPNIKNKVLKR